MSTSVVQGTAELEEQVDRKLNRAQRRALGQRGQQHQQTQEVRIFPPQRVEFDEFERAQFDAAGLDPDAYQAWMVLPAGGVQVQTDILPDGAGVRLTMQTMIPPAWLDAQPSKLALVADPRTGQPTSGAQRHIQEFLTEKLGLLGARLRFVTKKDALSPPAPVPLDTSRLDAALSDFGLTEETDDELPTED